MGGKVLRTFLTTLSLACGPLLVLASAGCSAPAERILLEKPRSQAVIFDSPNAIVRSEYLGRADWPSTTAFEDWSEGIVYQESVRDILTPYGFDRDSYYRRFDSWRTGSQRR